MSIEQIQTIDFMGVDDKTNCAILTISDHLDWKYDTDKHLLLLQDKLNTYLSFIESGEILEVYPNAKNRSIIISIIHKYPLNQNAQNFYDKIKQIIENNGVKFQHSLFDESWTNSTAT